MWEVEKLQEFFPHIFRDEGRVLDVGCGSGAFGKLYVESHVATSVYYKAYRDFTKRYSMCVASIPTPEALLYVLDREGYHVHGVCFPEFDFLSMVGFHAYVSRFRRGLNKLLSGSDVYLNKVLSRIAGALGMADYFAILASSPQD